MKDREGGRHAYMQSENVGADRVSTMFVFELRPQKTVNCCVCGEVYDVPFPPGHGELLCLATSVSPGPSTRPMTRIPGNLP